MLKAVLLLTLSVSCYGQSYVEFKEINQVIQYKIDNKLYDDNGEGVITMSLETFTWTFDASVKWIPNGDDPNIGGFQPFLPADWLTLKQTLQPMYAGMGIPNHDFGPQPKTNIILGIAPLSEVWQLTVCKHKFRKLCSNYFWRNGVIIENSDRADWTIDIFRRIGDNHGVRQTVAYGVLLNQTNVNLFGQSMYYNFVDGNFYYRIYTWDVEGFPPHAALSEPISFSMPVEEVEEDGPSGLAVAAFAIACSAAGVVVAHILVHALWRPAHTYEHVGKR